MAMTPSERLTLLKEISTRLGREDWSLIDVTLRQFGLPTEFKWEGTSVDYVLSMAEGGEDQTLLDLARHLGFDTHTQRPAIDPDCWRDGHFRLFTSHLASEKVFASNLQQALWGLQISSFVAHKDIEPSREWVDEIELALGTADALVALLHPGFRESKWVDQEIGFAMGRDIVVLSVRLGEDPHGFLGRFQALPGQPEEQLARAIFEVLVAHRQTRRQMTEALLTKLGDSDSFAEAKATMKLVEATSYWDSRLAERAESILENNDQVAGSWGVPQRLRALNANADS